jgi:hypothetical protein
MPGDRGLAFVIVGGICAIGLWIGSAHAISRPQKVQMVQVAPLRTIPAPAVFTNESKARLAVELHLTPLD